jgi:hypothetical protein
MRSIGNSTMKAVLAAIVAAAMGSAAAPGLAKPRFLNGLRHPGGGAGAALANCPNLAGAWHGQCRDETDAVSDETLEIEQDGCDQVIMDHFVVTVGGSTVMGTRAASGTGDITLFADWNAARTELEVRSTWLVRAHDQPTFITDLTRTRYYLDGEQLRSDESGKRTFEAAGGGRSEPYSSACTYTRAAR